MPDYVANLASDNNSTAFSEAKATGIVIGCGDWKPIQFYADTTGFPAEQIFANPSQEIFEALNTKRTISTAPQGEKVKDYITVSLPMNVVRSFYRMFSSLSTAVMAIKFQQGPADQNGGELIFDHDKRCTYAHIMQHAQDHTEVYDLMKLAGVSSRN